MRIRFLAALGIVLGLGAGAIAQPAEPTVEVRLQSVDVLLDKAEYVAGLAGKEDVVQAVKQILKGLYVEGKGIEGVDPKRPFGVYATLSADVINSPVTAMVPIANEDRFLTMLKDRLGVVPEKADGGAMKVMLPDFAQNPVLDAVFVRFSNDYLYVGRSAKDLDAKSLIAPKAIFTKDDGAVAAVLVRGDKIPADVKKFVLGQFELFVAEQRKKDGPNEQPGQKIIVDWLAGSAAGGIKSLFDDSKELQIRVFIDEKTDEMSAEAVLTPKTGSPMAQYAASLAKNTSLPAGIVSAKNAVARGTLRIGMPADMKATFAKMIDNLFAEFAKQGGADQQALTEKVLKVLAPTAKAAELDLATALYAPDAKGRHALVVAAMVKDGKEIEKLLKDLAMFAAAAADITFDVEKIGDFNLHKIALNAVPPELEKIFGTGTIWLAMSDTYLVASVEPDGALIRAGLKAKAVAVPVVSVEVSLAQLLPLVAKDLKPDEVKALLKDAFGDGGSAGKDTVNFTLTGGAQLTAKASVKGKGVKLMIGANVFKMN